MFLGRSKKNIITFQLEKSTLSGAMALSVCCSISESVVGFRYGQYVQGTVHVGSPEEICFLPESMKKVVKVSICCLVESESTEIPN